MKTLKNIFLKKIHSPFMGRILGLCFLLPFSFMFFLSLRISPLGIGWLLSSMFNILVAKYVVLDNWNCPINVSFSVFAFMSGIYNLGPFIHYFTLKIDPSGIDDAKRIIQIIRYFYISIPAVFWVFSHYFTKKELPKILTLCIIGCTIFFAISNACHYFIIDYIVRNEVLVPIKSPIYILFAYFAILIGLRCFSIIIFAYFKASPGKNKKAYRIFLISIFSTLIAYCVNFFLALNFNVFPIGGFVSIFCIGGMAYAVARYQLFDITIFLRKGVQYILVSSILLATYLLLVWLISSLLYKILEFQDQFIHTIFIIVMILFYKPILEVTQNLVDILFNRNRLNYGSISKEMSNAIQNEFESETILETLVTKLCQHLKLSQSCILLKDENEKVILAASYNSLNENFSWENTSKNMHYNLSGSWNKGTAELYIGEKISEQPLNSEDKNLIKTIHNQALMAIYRSNLAKELQEKLLLVKMGQWAAGINHEIKNLISPLKGYIQMLSSKIDKEFEGMVQSAWERSDDILKLAEELKEYSCKTILHKFDFDIRRIVNAVIRDIQHTNNGKSIEFIQNFPEDFPKIFGDGNRLRQVILNLIKNACEALKRAKIKKIEIKGEIISSGVSIKITDTGAGIPEHFHDYVFEPFKTSKGIKGTGLGLALAKKYVEAHNGNIYFESRVGSGTSFYIHIPLYNNTYSNIG